MVPTQRQPYFKLEGKARRLGTQSSGKVCNINRLLHILIMIKSLMPMPRAQEIGLEYHCISDAAWHRIPHTA